MPEITNFQIALLIYIALALCGALALVTHGRVWGRRGSQAADDRKSGHGGPRNWGGAGIVHRSSVTSFKAGSGGSGFQVLNARPGPDVPLTDSERAEINRLFDEPLTSV